MSEVESKGSRGWIFMLPFCGDVAQLSQAVALALFRLTTKIEERKDPHRLDDIRHAEHGPQRSKTRKAHLAHVNVEPWTPFRQAGPNFAR
eukprot:s1150_g16.t1